jgi:hypothetical protein
MLSARRSEVDQLVAADRNGLVVLVLELGLSSPSITRMGVVPSDRIDPGGALVVPVPSVRSLGSRSFRQGRDL